MSTTLRRAQLKLLRTAGFKYTKAKSNFKVPYLISLGDYSSENPFFKPAINSEEIIACIAWCLDMNQPVIFDIGAHCGYFSTHFASMLKKNDPRVFSFEPTTQTYYDLVSSVNKLHLRKNIFPMQAALSNMDSVVTLNYSKKYSMLSQIITDHENRTLPVEEKNFALATTLNRVVKELNIVPQLIKLDVEGFESFVLQGASDILQRSDKPAICIEWNPGTLNQCGSSATELASLLKGYELFYLDDYEFGKKKFLEKIDDPTTIPWVCNLFAVPLVPGAVDKWKHNIELLQKQYNISK